MVHNWEIFIATKQENNSYDVCFFKMLKKRLILGVDFYCVFSKTSTVLGFLMDKAVVVMYNFKSKPQ